MIDPASICSFVIYLFFYVSFIYICAFLWLIILSDFFCYRQLSMSENLAKLANKIDFYKDECEEKGKPTSEGEKESEEEKATTFQPSLWPWDSVRNKLK